MSYEGVMILTFPSCLVPLRLDVIAFMVNYETKVGDVIALLQEMLLIESLHLIKRVDEFLGYGLSGSEKFLLRGVIQISRCRT